ncbi:MAG: hypothetical protein FWF92_00290 [Oscillospiraceae bacterium]|nr:hypothetical protein [Oscillospiraceae bacterium]
MTELHKTWLFQNPNEIPVSFWLCNPTWKRFGDDLEKLVLEHPRFFPEYKKGEYKDYKNDWWAYQPGKHLDHWGCEWNNIIEGHDSICINHPVKTLEDALNISIPEQNIGLEHGLIFLRYTYLRGYEEAMIDLYEKNKIYQVLMEKVFLYAKKQTENAVKNADEKGNLFVSFADDLGMQTSLPTGPDVWRETIGVWYEKLFSLCKDRNKMIFMHTDGCIYEIIPDLRRYGLDVINAQFRANGLEKLKEVTRGERYNKIALHLDLDRQLFPVATPDEIERHIWDCVNTLAMPEGGLSVYAEISEDIPLANIQRIIEVFEKVIDYYK